MMFLLVVTVTSMVLAGIMSVIAWRIAREERRRSEARIAALAADIHDDVAAVSLRRADAGVPGRAEGAVGAEEPSWGSGAPVGTSFGATQRWHDELELRPAAAAHADLFSAAQPAPSASRWPAVLGIGALTFGGAAALAIVLSAGPRKAAQDEAVPRTTATAATLPLELVALGHERDGDRLTVRGVVRNPVAASEIDGVTAVVFVFTRDGGFLTSGRMPLQSSALRPGAEATFAVTVTGASDVGRYRVSFRTDDRIVPHVDRRTIAPG
jgi:hypothetical protein